MRDSVIFLGPLSHSKRGGGSANTSHVKFTSPLIKPQTSTSLTQSECLGTGLSERYIDCV